MKKYLHTSLFIGLFFFFSGYLSAQPVPEQVKSFDDIKPEINQKIDELKQQLNNGEIQNEEELTSRMYNLIYDIEAKMNPLPEAEIATEDLNHDMMHGHDTVDMPSINKMPKRNSRLKMNTFFRIGFATALENGTNPADAPDINFWRSAMMEIGLKFRNRLNASGSVGLNYGVSYLYYDFDTKNQVPEYLGSKDKIIFHKQSDLKDSDFGASYVSVPVAFDFGVSKRLKVDVGGYIGILLNGFSSIESTTAFDQKIYTTSYARYNMNSFIYGVHLGFGFRNGGIYAKYNLNSMFKDTYNLNPFSVGLQFAF